MKKCPFCAEEIQDEAIVCKHCGRDLVAAPVQAVAPAPPVPQPAKKRTSPVAAGCAVILALLVVGWCVSIVAGPSTSSRTAPPAGPPTTLTTEQAEARAKALEATRRQTVPLGLAAAMQVVSDPKECDTPKSIANAWNKLRVVRKGDPEWTEAVALTAKLEACRTKTERSLSKSVQTIMAAQRQAWATQAERAMLDQGMEVDFILSGAAKDQLTLKWVLMGKVAVHKITTGGSMAEGSFLSNLQKNGFKRVTFTDGYDFGSYYDLEPIDEAKGGSTVLASLGIGAPLKLQVVQSGAPVREDPVGSRQ